MTKMYQAVVIIENCDINSIIAQSVKAGMEIMNQYDPESPAYVGKYEEKQFRSLFKAWVDDGAEQITFTAPDSAVLKEIEFLAGLESTPMNFLDENPEVLVIGPYDSSRLDLFLQNCTKI